MLIKDEFDFNTVNESQREIMGGNYGIKSWVNLDILSF